MSLISQRVATKSRVKGTRDEADEPMINDDNGAGNVEEAELAASRSKKRRKEKEEQLEMEEEREMSKLENVLFGSLYSPVEFGTGVEKTEDSIAEDPVLFYVDHSTNDVFSAQNEIAEPAAEGKDQKDKKQREAVWVDEEEEQTNIDIAKVNRLRKLRKEEDESLISGKEYISRLRAQHVKLHPGTEWAQPDSHLRKEGSFDDSSDEEDGVVIASDYENAEGVVDILRTDEELVVKSSGKLLSGLLEYSKLIDANAEDPSNGPINSVQFHRNAQLLLTAGLDKKIRFFQIDGRRNTKIQSVFLDDCPVRRASFLPDGSQVIISGRRKFFYSFDLVKAKVDKVGPLVGREERSLEFFEVSPDSSTIAFVGNEGYILLVSTKTKELIGTLKMNGTVRSLAFADDGRQLLSSGGDGQVYHWDLRTRTCIHTGIDEGSINGTSICTSPDGRLFASGSDSGIVNIYNRGEFLGGKRKPIKAVENLTTKIDFMKFNNDSQILAICSTMKKNSLKLVHVPTLTVFSNWPPPNQNIHYPRCLDFSPGGGFMAVGNSAGKVLLYKLHHYHQA